MHNNKNVVSSQFECIDILRISSPNERDSSCLIISESVQSGGRFGGETD
jgi:hypothetical protein